MFSIKKISLFFISSLLSLYVSKSIAQEVLIDSQPGLLIQENQEEKETSQVNDEDNEDEFDDEEYEDEDTFLAVDSLPYQSAVLVPVDETIPVQQEEVPLLENAIVADQISATEIVVSTEESHQAHDEHPVDEDEDFDFEDDYSFEEKTEEEDERKHGNSIKIQPRKPVVLTWKNTVALIFASIKDAYTEWSNFLYKKFSVIARYKTNIKK